MRRSVTTEEAAQLLGTTPTALRAALSRDPSAPTPTGLGGHSNLWDLDQIISWDRARVRRTPRTDPDRGRPVGSMSLIVGDTIGIVTGWWVGDTLRMDMTALPARRETRNVATLPGIGSVDVAVTLMRNLSRALTGVSEIGGPTDPLPDNSMTPEVSAIVARIRATLTAAIQESAAQDARDVASRVDTADAAVKESAEVRVAELVDREARVIRTHVQDLDGDWGPWVRTTIMGVTNSPDWALGDVQRALNAALPGEPDLQREAFLRVLWAKRHPDSLWPGVDRAEDMLD